MKQKSYLLKGKYEHSQIPGYFTVKEYIMLEQEGQHCLLLRFQNDMKTPVHAVSFAVQQYDADGNLLASVPVEYENLFIEPKARYSSTQGIVLHEKCVDFAIFVKYIISGSVKYVFKKGIVTEHYEVREYRPRKRHIFNGNKATVLRKYNGNGRGYALIAILSLILAALALLPIIFD